MLRKFFVAKEDGGNLFLYHRNLRENEDRFLRNKIEGSVQTELLGFQLGDVVTCELVDESKNQRFWMPVEFHPRIDQFIIPIEDDNEEACFPERILDKHAGELWECTPVRITREDRIEYTLCRQITYQRPQVDSEGLVCVDTVSGHKIIRSEPLVALETLDVYFRLKPEIVSAKYRIQLAEHQQIIVQADYDAMMLSEGEGDGFYIQHEPGENSD